MSTNIPKTLPQQSFRLMVGPLDGLKPLRVAVVKGDPAQLHADAYVTVKSTVWKESLSRAERMERMNRQFGSARIIKSHDEDFTAVTRSEGNHYYGVNVQIGRRAKASHNCMDELCGHRKGSTTFRDMLKVVGDDGARSAIIDCDRCYYSPVLSGDSMHAHRTISSVISGVHIYVRMINVGQIESLVGDIVLVMGAEMYALWERGREMYIQGMGIPDFDAEVRCVEARLSELVETGEALHDVIKAAMVAAPAFSGDERSMLSLTHFVESADEKLNAISDELRELRGSYDQAKQRILEQVGASSEDDG